ncbi:hypothetical protein COW36_15195 [bacterium (Candidatus Blackallbacteria) CG17_big_fil_post_rev_8_21_14_2_50_48_46]|uniref:Uncharacterized protein n=1 Tax=bacterium (Candidatus Blackallbacteria) CG17_big_fil_post_rev_8_21_14_2_50_48_46 TaxID=2014261 RepID=A0A2M7G2N4_9BACT|nr:MAG: hypothetical protein COW64_11355 [bacterium (Candidatus Blackallbacteria) CG18_big_fil_WC_8_21_14_2_50_49_26]PIW16056.1 MAG: hypothetical protein COW36_15195 [bacterium (Candidatus Blackallbacteria) CG17_big_fil_post_rev_8_21_14_2_50_48_46]PIW50468.1 MAG: hypothetical protein COW20_02910 [bacterium (Candidatus Blackallbacteria) CG13_big_fil_rev_8_21_14_2_50_49_14]
MKRNYKEKQVHILVGCADARDLSRIYIQALIETIKEYEAKGIQIEFHKIRTPGSFVTPDVITDLKDIFEQHQRLSEDGIPHSYFVHVQAHGELVGECSEDFACLTHEVAIKEGSSLNCGMLGATKVALELEKLLLEQEPRFALPGQGHITLRHEQDIRVLLREVYAFNGYFAGDWVRSIDDLRTHPRTQRAALEHAARHDATLKNLNIQITANIKDYQQHALIRVDGGEPEVPFWHDFHLRLREKAKRESLTGDLAMAQASTQKPLAGLICTSPYLSSRLLAKQYYLEYKGLKPNQTISNTIFKLRGNSFDMPMIPFGPYTIAGYFYGVKFLGLTDQLVMGNDQEQTQRIIQKIKRDPIMSFITEHFGVELISISHRELEQREKSLLQFADYELMLLEHERLYAA